MNATVTEQVKPYLEVFRPIAEINNRFDQAVAVTSRISQARTLQLVGTLDQLHMPPTHFDTPEIERGKRILRHEIAIRDNPDASFIGVKEDELDLLGKLQRRQRVVDFILLKRFAISLSFKGNNDPFILDAIDYMVEGKQFDRDATALKRSREVWKSNFTSATRDLAAMLRDPQAALKARSIISEM